MQDNAIRNREFLGQGLAFPLQVSPRGRVLLAAGENDIAQAILIILGTIPGERVMRPAFGCRAWALLFDPNQAVTHGLMEQYVHEALAMWEPRITVQRVRAMRIGADGNGIQVHIDYEIKDTHDPRSIVFPFTLAEEAAALPNATEE
jgi:phage baseplate assembly protein W